MSLTWVPVIGSVLCAGLSVVFAVSARRSRKRAEAALARIRALNTHFSG